MAAYFTIRYKMNFMKRKCQQQQGRIQDLKLGGAIKMFFWVFRVKKSRFYKKKSYFFPMGGGAHRVPPWIRPWAVTNKSTNINNASNHLSLQINEHKNTTFSDGTPGAGFGHVHKFGDL